MSSGLVLCLVALGALILNPIFGAFSALLFLVSGGLLVVSKPRHSVTVLLNHWFLLLLPAYCLLSVLWSQYPGLSLRYGLQLAMTFVIAIVIAHRVKPLNFVRCLFAIYCVGILASLLFGHVRSDIGAWVGIFGSKNAFAAVVSGFALTAFAVLFDRGSERFVRFAALIGVMIAGPLLIRAQSTGAILIMVPSVLMIFILLFSRRMSSTLKWVVSGAVLLAGVAITMMLVSYAGFLLEQLLEQSGKDATLTGRTELWAFAWKVIEDQPVLGVGYQAFWVRGFGPAEVLWDMFDVDRRSGFNFHNTYISNTVEIGLVGLLLQVFILYGSLLNTLICAWKSTRPETIFFAAFLTFVVCASFFEVAVFFQFSVTSIIVVCVFIYARRANLEDAARSARQVLFAPMHRAVASHSRK